MFHDHVDTFQSHGYWFLVRVWRIACLLCCWLAAIGARADDVRARELFDSGVEAGLAQDWDGAARLFEASLADRDKPACRFNLVLAYAKVHRPLDVARHAIAFLATVVDRSHADEAERVRAALAAAAAELVTLKAEGLPLGAQLKIDGAPPRVLDGSRIYELPGLHRLELWLGDRQWESIEMELSAGTVQSWPRARPVQAPPLINEHTHPSATIPSGNAPALVDDATLAGRTKPARAAVQKKIAWTLGGVGAVTGSTAMLTYGYVARRADVLRDKDPAQPGYTDAADRYSRARLSIIPLAFTGGILMACATSLVLHKTRRPRTVSIAALIAGLAATGMGAALMVRRPRTLIGDTEITRPSRQAGSLLLEVSLPLLTYGARLQWSLWREPTGSR